MDEVIGKTISVVSLHLQKQLVISDRLISTVTDFILWYAKDIDQLNSSIIYT